MRLVLLAAVALLAAPFASLLSSASGTLSTINLYVAASGGDDTGTCSRTKPCATLERACQFVPSDIGRPYIIHVAAGTYSAGCHLVGRRQSTTPDWTSPGSLVIRGTHSAYDPGDGGNNTALLGWVTPGNLATRDVWGFDGGSYNSDELKGLWVEVTSGTGADPGKRWLVTGNASDRMTVEAVSTGIGPAAAPAAGSGVAFYRSATVINGNLEDTILPIGFPQQTAIGAAFIVGANGGSYGGDSLGRPFLAMERLKFGSGASRGVIVGDGSLVVRESECATASSCVHGSDGRLALTFERNLLTGSGPAVVLGGAAAGSDSNVIATNNVATSTIGGFIWGGRVGLLLSGMNTVTANNIVIQANDMAEGVSKWDKFTSSSACLASPLASFSSGIGSGIRLDAVGLSCTSTGPYAMSLGGQGDAVHFDATSSVTSSNHHAALAGGAELWWASGATWGGAGTDTFVFSATGSSMTEAGLTSGALAKYLCDNQGTCAGIRTQADGIYSAVVSPAGSTSGADGQFQLCSGTATATLGVATVTFASAKRCGNFSAAPSCGCSDPSDGGVAVACAPTSTSATTATFFGDPSKGTSSLQWWCTGPK